jgi:hypothetical protein
MLPAMGSKQQGPNSPPQGMMMLLIPHCLLCIFQLEAQEDIKNSQKRCNFTPIKICRHSVPSCALELCQIIIAFQLILENVLQAV